MQAAALRHAVPNMALACSIHFRLSAFDNNNRDRQGNEAEGPEPVARSLAADRIALEERATSPDRSPAQNALARFSHGDSCQQLHR
jgi:hypothetical protein